MKRFMLAAISLSLLSACSDGSNRFAEDRRIEGPFEIGTEWQRIEFAPPLELNREGLQRFHLLVDRDLYSPNSEHDLSDRRNQANLRRNDGVLVQPAVVLIGDNGEEVELRARANFYPENGEGITVGFSTYESHFAPAPPFPDNIKAFVAAKVRSNEPLIAEKLLWRVDVHPDIHACGGKQCPFWYSWFQ